MTCHMAYPADFSDAHVRHWRDAELLYGARCWGNADQLYGFSAECGLKAVMTANGMRVDGAGAPRERRHKQHIQDLWGTFRSFVYGRPTATFLHHLPDSNPFAAWSHHNRYASSRHFDEPAVARHREAAKRVRRFCLRLMVSGHV